MLLMKLPNRGAANGGAHGRWYMVDGEEAWGMGTAHGQLTR